VTSDELEWSRDRRTSFDRVAHTYDARPPYPTELYDLLSLRGVLAPGARVLEIGPGNGVATADLVARGAAVTAVEPGPEMASVLAARLPKVHLHRGTFEEVELPTASFDAVVSATAFHWVEPAVGAAKVADVLVDGGWLALWWGVFGDPRREDPFDDALLEILRVKEPRLIAAGGGFAHHAFDLDGMNAQFAPTGAFGPFEQIVIEWETHDTPEEVRALFATFSPFLALPDDRREELLDDIEMLARERFGGVVTRPCATVLYLARREVRSG